MKEKLFKHLLNVTTGAVCATIMVGTMTLVVFSQEEGIRQETAFQITFPQETDQNEDETSPQNDIDDIETKYK